MASETNVVMASDLSVPSRRLASSGDARPSRVRRKDASAPNATDAEQFEFLSPSVEAREEDSVTDFEFYETPGAFTRWLFREVRIRGTVFEPCVGDGAIIRAADPPEMDCGRRWVTNDLDTRWPADYHEDAASAALWARQGLQAVGGIDWTVSNPPFTPAIEIIEHALKQSRVGVAMHLRASIHEVLKTGVRRTWMREHTPTGLLWLPRFAYQRSKTTGKWTTDSVCACWVIWLTDQAVPQFIRYAPTWVIDDLKREEPAYRRRMDALMGRAAA